MKPILFNTDMVRAILSGRKTVTRRVVKGADKQTMYAGECVLGAGLFDKETNQRIIAPPYKVNDVLYVRETWGERSSGYWYKADGELIDHVGNFIKWKPSIHMPKEAARLFLKVTYVGVELLQDMELHDFIAEGIILSREELRDQNKALYNARNKFSELWNSTSGKKGTQKRYANNWYGNPYVWVIEFEVISKEEALRSGK